MDLATFRELDTTRLIVMCVAPQDPAEPQEVHYLAFFFKFLFQGIDVIEQ